eukprot:3238129-Prorocentrum_lima.AAC.1
MTSSLVGSEMCIRDRYLHSAILLRQPVFVKFGRKQLGMFFQSCDGVDAVSYTHLTLPTICSV